MNFTIATIGGQPVNITEQGAYAGAAILLLILFTLGYIAGRL